MNRCFCVAWSIFFVGIFSSGVFAFPDKPIKAIIGYEPGSSSDISGRTYLQMVEKELGQSIVIINKPGASSALALREISSSKPDGYTIGLSCSVNVLKFQGLLPFTHRELSVLGIPSISWAVLAVPAKSPYKTVKELIAFAKANPGKLRFTTTTKGAVHWIQAKYFEQVTGTRYNLISNPGGSNFVVTQLGGGHADLGFTTYRALQSQIDAGNVRILAVSTEKRVPGFMDLPTLMASSKVKLA